MHAVAGGFEIHDCRIGQGEESVPACRYLRWYRLAEQLERSNSYLPQSVRLRLGAPTKQLPRLQHPMTDS